MHKAAIPRMHRGVVSTVNITDFQTYNIHTFNKMQKMKKLASISDLDYSTNQQFWVSILIVWHNFQQAQNLERYCIEINLSRKIALNWNFEFCRYIIPTKEAVDFNFPPPYALLEVTKVPWSINLLFQDVLPYLLYDTAHC